MLTYLAINYVPKFSISYTQAIKELVENLYGIKSNSTVFEVIFVIMPQKKFSIITCSIH